MVSYINTSTHIAFLIHICIFFFLCPPRVNPQKHVPYNIYTYTYIYISPIAYSLLLMAMATIGGVVRPWLAFLNVSALFSTFHTRSHELELSISLIDVCMTNLIVPHWAEGSERSNTKESYIVLSICRRHDYNTLAAFVSRGGGPRLATSPPGESYSCFAFCELGRDPLRFLR